MEKLKALLLVLLTVGIWYLTSYVMIECNIKKWYHLVNCIILILTSIAGLFVTVFYIFKQLDKQN